MLGEQKRRRRARGFLLSTMLFDLLLLLATRQLCLRLLNPGQGIIQILHSIRARRRARTCLVRRARAGAASALALSSLLQITMIVGTGPRRGRLRNDFLVERVLQAREGRSIAGALLRSRSIVWRTLHGFAGGTLATSPSARRQQSSWSSRPSESS